MRILVVEDDPVGLQLLQRTLVTFGHDVVCAGDGKEAWEYWDENHCPVIITDWEMPRMTGTELCRRIRSCTRATYTYIIMLTTHGGRESRIEGLSVGADDYVAKPFDAAELRMRLCVAERIIGLETKLRDANMRLQQSNLTLQKTSRLDPLMEIGNRLAFEEQIAAYHAAAARAGEVYSILMCDIDHFKACNDRYGHQQGDDVLRGVAAGVRQSVRSDDAAFRYGGEEILVLLGRQNLRNAALTADRMRKRIGELEFRTAGGGELFHVSISCGVASYPRSTANDPDWKDLVGQADAALYQAKDRGRNRIVAAEMVAGRVRFLSIEDLSSLVEPVNLPLSAASSP